MDSKTALRTSKALPHQVSEPAVPDIYPLDAPGLASPGEHLLRNAEVRGISVEQLISEYLFARPSPSLYFLYQGAKRAALPVVPGHLAVPTKTTIRGARTRVAASEAPYVPWYGPRMQMPVMIIGKVLGVDEERCGVNFVGNSGALLYKVLGDVSFDLSGVYITNLVKTFNPDGQTPVLKSLWCREWFPVLQQELRLVRPRLIVCLGTDAGKALFGKHITISGMEGRVEEYCFPVGRTAEDTEVHTSYVFVLPHPAGVLRAPEDIVKLQDGFNFVKRYLAGTPTVHEQVDHRLISTAEEFEALVKEIEDTCQDDLLAFDAEWHGEHPGKGAYLRTVQLSWKHGTAACIRLRRCGGEYCFEGSMDVVFSKLASLAAGRRVAGHYFNADLEFLVANGLDLRRAFAVPDSAEAYRRQWQDLHIGGFDTALAAHALEESAEFRLKSLAVRFGGVHRYDVALEKWKHEYCAAKGLKDSDLEGFGDCPDDVLLGVLQPNGQLENSYACYDADVTRRLAIKFAALLDEDSRGHNCWEPFWATMRANQAIFEINTTGVMVDLQRLDELSESFLLARNTLAEWIRQQVNWPDLNLESLLQVRELLFGEAYNGAKQKDEAAGPIRLRPDGALSLGLTPVLTTDKTPMDWDVYLRYLAEGKVDGGKTPAANKLALAILANSLEARASSLPPSSKNSQAAALRRELQFKQNVVKKLREYRIIAQVLKTVLRPKTEAEDGSVLRSEGLASYLCEDGRIRTTIYPTLETGRWSSSRPNLQNISKRREADYSRILSSLDGVGYVAPIRSVFVPSPGCLFVEADYKSAELVAMAILSGDPILQEHTRRAMLAEDSPDYYDIHSNVAVAAFGLQCKPTKKGLAEIGKKHLRDVTKGVVYGLAYGRGAKAIARGVQEEGIIICEEDAKAIEAAFFNTYERLEDFFADCRARVRNPGWMVNVFGRRRRFPYVKDPSQIAEQERQAMNFPVQSLVADVVNRGVAALQAFREKYGLNYRIVLQIHDAILLEVPKESVRIVVEKVLPECLVHSVPIWKANLDGVRETGIGAGPFYLDIDVSVMRRWGEAAEP